MQPHIIKAIIRNNENFEWFRSPKIINTPTLTLNVKPASINPSVDIVNSRQCGPVAIYRAVEMATQR